MEFMDKIKQLEKKAVEVRRYLVTAIHKGGDGHPGPSLSIADRVTALYFEIMDVRPEEPNWEDRDRFILSKGHGCPTLYSALILKGYFSEDHIPTLRRINSKLQGHPDMTKTVGVDASTGPLGNGISFGIGMALAARMNNKDYYTYVITGDGELNEGVIWEGVMSAAHYKVDNLIVFVDNNDYQSGGKLSQISGIYPIPVKFESFGWHVQEIDGHNMKEILDSVAVAKSTKGVPSVIIARTVKGKGIPMMENNNAWHKAAPDRDQYEEMMATLGIEPWK